MFFLGDSDPSAKQTPCAANAQGTCVSLKPNTKSMGNALEMRWLHGQKVFCACFLFFWCIWSQKCPEIICNFMQNSSGLTRSQAYQRLFPCMRQLWNWALHGLNNGRPVTLAEQNQVSTLSFISANGIINYK